MANKRRRKEGNPSRGVSNLAKTTSFGVCTRAKSMALKGSMASLATEKTMMDNEGDGCYLHLRSRRLLRYPPLFVKRARKNKCGYKKKGFNHDEKENLGVIKHEEKRKDKEKIAFGENEGENRMVEKEEMEFKRGETNKNEEKDDYGEKAQDSFGENDLDFERVNTRESTPSSFIMGKGEISTPTSSNKATFNKQMTSGNPKIHSVQDLEEFFAEAEKQSIEKFINKYEHRIVSNLLTGQDPYNFDVKNEKPCKGRFEWVKIKP